MPWEEACRTGVIRRRFSGALYLARDSRFNFASRLPGRLNKIQKMTPVPQDTQREVRYLIVWSVVWKGWV